MPSYKVIAPGYFNGHIYDPKGKRPVLHTDTPFKKKEMPSWLAEMPEESAAVRKKREAQEASAAAAAAEQVEQGQKDIQDASFMGDGEHAGAKVETL